MVSHAPPVSGPVFCMSHTPFAFPVLFYIHIQWLKSTKCFLNSFVMEFLRAFVKGSLCRISLAFFYFGSRQDFGSFIMI